MNEPFEPRQRHRPLTPHRVYMRNLVEEMMANHEWEKQSVPCPCCKNGRVLPEDVESLEELAAKLGTRKLAPVEAEAVSVPSGA